MIALLMASMVALPLALAQSDASSIHKNVVSVRALGKFPSGFAIDAASTFITTEEVAEEVGFSASDVKESLEEFETDPEVQYIVIGIIFWGPEVKGFLFERRAAVVTQNGDKSLKVFKTYKGIIGTADGERFRVRGNDLSDLSIVSKTAGKTIERARPSLTAVESVTSVIGKANLDITSKTLTLTFNSGETKSYKLTNIERRPIRDIAPGKIVSEIAKEKVPFWKRWFNSQRASDSSVSVEAPEEYGAEEEGEGPANAGEVPTPEEEPTVLVDSETRRFSLLEWLKNLFSERRRANIS